MSLRNEIKHMPTEITSELSGIPHGALDKQPLRDLRKIVACSEHEIKEWRAFQKTVSAEIRRREKVNAAKAKKPKV